jgi:hypothetical protein
MTTRFLPTSSCTERQLVKPCDHNLGQIYKTIERLGMAASGHELPKSYACVESNLMMAGARESHDYFFLPSAPNCLR